MKSVKMGFAVAAALGLFSGVLNAAYDPRIAIHNKSGSAVSVRLLEKSGSVVDGPVAITALSTGFVTLPDVVNWESDYPMNNVLNDRKLEVTFESPHEVKTFWTTYLNWGRGKDDVVITKSRQIGEASDPNMAE